MFCGGKKIVESFLMSQFFCTNFFYLECVPSEIFKQIKIFAKNCHLVFSEFVIFVIVFRAMLDCYL